MSYLVSVSPVNRKYISAFCFLLCMNEHSNTHPGLIAQANAIYSGGL